MQALTNNEPQIPRRVRSYAFGPFHIELDIPDALLAHFPDVPTTGSTQTIRLCLDVAVPDLQAPANGRMLADRSPAWSLYRTPDGYVVTLARQESEKGAMGPLAMHCDLDLRTVCLVSANDLLQADLSFCLKMYFRLLLQHRDYGLLVHAAGAVVHGNAIIFPASSGTGKSTISANFPFGDSPDCGILSEELILIYRVGDVFFAAGSPFYPLGIPRSPLSAPIAAVGFLEQAQENALLEISLHDAIRRFTLQCHLPEWDPLALARAATTMRQTLVQGSPLRILSRPGKEIWRAIERELLDGSST